MICKTKMATLGQKILYPILLMVLFQIFIFWLFVFQLGLFDSVVKQSQGIFISNALADTRQIDAEMWGNFSNLSNFSKSYSAIRKEYIASHQNNTPFVIQDNMVTSLALDSSTLHIDGVYLELFSDARKREDLHFRINPQDLFMLYTEREPNFKTDILPLFSTYSSNVATELPAFRDFLKQLEHSNQNAGFQDFYHGNWSPILNIDNERMSLFYAAPLNYKKSQYGTLATEIFLTRFDELLRNTAFPKNYPHQSLLVQYHRQTKDYEIISNIAFNMEALSSAAAGDLIGQALDGLKNTKQYTFESIFNREEYLCSANQLVYSSEEDFPHSTTMFYYIALAPKSVVMYDATLLKRTFLFLVVLFILFSIVIALFITKRVVSPISLLTAAIDKKDVAAGDKPLPKTNITEIDILTNTLYSQSQNIQGFHQMITDTMIASEITLVTFFTDTVNKVTYGFGTFRALLGPDYSEEYIMKFNESEFEVLEKKIFRDFTLFSADSHRIGDNTVRTEVYFDSVLHKYICVKSRELKNGRTRVFLDYTNYILEQEQLKRERDYDTLTSLLNRFSFTEKAVRYLEANPDKPVAMVMWDLDYLKMVNDTYGHDIGDSYLRKAGEILSELDPKRSFVARVSGDEFFALLFDYDSKKDMVHEIKRIHYELNRAYIDLCNGQTCTLSASCGYIYSVGGSYEELKKNADSAMYASKKSTKGSIHEFLT